ncbi:MAG: LysE family translocator [Promethearchaeota archaeon]|jgi:threonine/homoserine/homoserine lactone efflux protein
MAVELWIACVSTALLLMITPGPSQLLMLSNTLGHGFRNSKFTAAGDLTANALQMFLASAGLASILYASEYTFLLIKWAGVVYLIYIGVKQVVFTRNSSLANTRALNKSRKKLYSEGFLTSASNPKAIIFFVAFFPQFINPHESILSQLFILGLTYLVLDGIFLSLYGAFSDWIAMRFKNRFLSLLDKISGSCLILAAILLGLKKVEP